MKLFNTSAKRWTFGIVITLALLGGGLWGGRRIVVPKIKAWRVQRMNNEAREFLAKGDATNALLIARKILQSSKDNVEAWRIAVAATKTRDAPEIVWYQENLARLEPTKANYIELIRLAVHHKAYAWAIEAIKNVAKNASDDPEFHALAAETYMHTPGRAVAAKFHLIALTQLKPSDRSAQLDLAQLEMAEDPGRKDVALRARVRALADDPALRVRALSLLLRESINAKLRVETGELVSRLQAVPNLGIAERLLLLEGTIMLEGTPSPVILEQLQKEVAGKPADALQVMAFLARTNQQKKSVEWFATLPEDTRKDESMRRMVAEAYVATRDWVALESHLRAVVWPKMEHMRQAYLAYSYRMQLRLTDCSTAWHAAVVATGNDRVKATELLARAEEWKWTDERYEVLWKLFSLMPNNALLQQSLMNWAKAQGKTADLNRMFARMVEVEPRNAVARNNLAYTSMLLDSNLSRAGLISRELVAQRPDDAFIVTTYAFSLFKQGDFAGALKQMETLSAAELSEPVRMLHRAVYLAYAGDSSRASEMIKGIDLKKLLPEEQKLAESAQLQIARSERGVKNERIAAVQSGGKSAVEGGWLLLVAADTRNSASVDMRLSDSLYAAGDWNGLQVSLRAGDWKTEDYLRSALLAFASRQQEDMLQSRDNWRRALASAGRNLARVQNLQKLAAQWNWTVEYLETQNIVFERNPTDRLLLAELLKNYREAKRTQDLIRVLTIYVGRTSEVSEEAVALAYYSLLSDINVPRAHVIAKNGFETVPDDTARRLVYAFSLWKQQKRAGEALALLADLKPGAVSDLVPLPLLRAAIQVELNAPSEARAALAQFDETNALPEETALAAKLKAQLDKQDETKKSN